MNTTDKSFAERVDEFVTEAFSPEGARSVEERTHRFLEEAIELAQATGCTEDEAHQLVGYVLGRPVGAPYQEVGGVMLTLHALSTAVGLDADRCGEAELERAKGKIDVIREKHLSKPRRSPLPGQPSVVFDEVDVSLARLEELADGDEVWVEIAEFRWKFSRAADRSLMTYFEPIEGQGAWTTCPSGDETLLRAAIRGGARVVKAGEALPMSPVEAKGDEHDRNGQNGPESAEQEHDPHALPVHGDDHTGGEA